MIDRPTDRSLTAILEATVVAIATCAVHAAAARVFLHTGLLELAGVSSFHPATSSLWPTTLLPGCFT